MTHMIYFNLNNDSKYVAIIFCKSLKKNSSSYLEV